MKLGVLRNSLVGINPPCLKALSVYVGPRYEEKHELPPPIGLVNHSWSKVLIAYSNALPHLEAAILLPWETHPTKEAMNRLLYSYNEVLSRAVEFLEDLSKNTGLALSRSADKKDLVDIKGSDALRSSVAMPLNKLKHNHNRLAYVEGFHSDTRVPGVAFYHYREGRFQPNKMMHQNRPAYSLAFEYRRIFATLFLYCQQVEEKLSIINQSYHGPMLKPIHFPDQETVDLVTRLEGLPSCGLLDENASIAPTVTLNERELIVATTCGYLIEQPKGSQVRFGFIADGTTFCFDLPTIPGNI